MLKVLLLSILLFSATNWTDQEKKAKAYNEQQYILSRIRGIQDDEFEKQRLEGLHEFSTINKY